MKLLICLTFLISVTSAFANVGCKINQFGHNICVGEHALMEEESSLKKVEVIKHSYYETVVKKGRKKITTDIDELIGNKICKSSDTVCKGQTITISDHCKEQYKGDEYKVKEVYENNTVESEVGSIFSRKTLLIPEECIDA
jgi:hypothetical protein